MHQIGKLLQVQLLAVMLMQISFDGFDRPAFMPLVLDPPQSFLENLPQRRRVALPLGEAAGLRHERARRLLPFRQPLLQGGGRFRCGIDKNAPRHAQLSSLPNPFVQRFGSAVEIARLDGSFGLVHPSAERLRIGLPLRRGGICGDGLSRRSIPGVMAGGLRLPVRLAQAGSAAVDASRPDPGFHRDRQPAQQRHRELSGRIGMVALAQADQQSDAPSLPDEGEAVPAQLGRGPAQLLPVQLRKKKIVVGRPLSTEALAGFKKKSPHPMNELPSPPNAMPYLRPS
ncbi:hypothetical protein BN871_BQ_00020 [Paenibacillus sp. P22]|nr:hypothetical protein BN871_BQ_00020 [Paenibacillus sp. P22]